ncbi:hypothetical protein F4861DRAFT_544578, partial [Xylaria intraflava]
MSDFAGTPTAMAALYPFSEAEGWHHFDRDVPVSGGHGTRKVTALEPCSPCVTKCHIDLRAQCICKEAGSARCGPCDRDHSGCVSIPTHLRGAAQRVTQYAAHLRPHAETFQDVLARADSAEVRVNAYTTSGRAFYILNRASLALRAAIGAALPLSPEAERLEAIRCEVAAVRADIVALCRVAETAVQICQRAVNGQAPTAADLDSLRVVPRSGEPASEPTLVALHKALQLLMTHPLTEPLPTGECDWTAIGERQTIAQWVCMDSSYWNGPGADLLRSSLTAPKEIGVKGTRPKKPKTPRSARNSKSAKSSFSAKAPRTPSRRSQRLLSEATYISSDDEKIPVLTPAAPAEPVRAEPAAPVAPVPAPAPVAPAEP